MNPVSLRCFLVAFISICCVRITAAQEARCADAPFVVEKISQLHVSTPNIYSDEFRNRLLEIFVQEIDPQALFLSQVETERIRKFPLVLEKQKSNACELISLAEGLYKIQLDEYQKFLKATLAKPLDFTVNEYFDYNFNSNSKPESNLTSLKNRWVRWLKLQVLMRQQRLTDQQKKESIRTFEKEAREKEMNRQLVVTDRLVKSITGKSPMFVKLFFKSLSKAFDPHTEYFTKSEMDEFEMTISKSSFSWGFSVGENKLGQAVVNNIVPGSSAWKSNAIHKEDLIVSIHFENELPIDAIDYEADELSKMLRDPAKKKMTITLQRLDGEMVKVNLEKSEIESEENFVQGFVIQANKKLGYISLPAFYTDWTDPNSKGCANDVAKELVKLKKDNIQGLILDLRFNGGGLVSEAIDLAGIFVDYGPVALFKGKDQPPVILKDINRGVAFDGPLLILVNGFSASASELVAAALQDYHRAIIVGSTTFGKATGQAVVPLFEKDSIGFVKITEDKIYRINGKTHQRTGVTPDIQLPDFTDLFGISEKSFVTSLPSDSIVKKVIFNPLPVIPVNELKSKSEDRVNSSSPFQSIKSIHHSFTLTIPLQTEAFLKYVKSGELLSDLSSSGSFQIRSSNFDDRVLKVNSYENELREKTMKELRESPYLQEAIHILEDYIEIKSKAK